MSNSANKWQGEAKDSAPDGMASLAAIPAPGDFGGQCLIGQCAFDPKLLLPDSSYLGLPKSASYFYGTWRDADGNLLRALRGVHGSAGLFAFAFVSKPGHQIERCPETEKGLYLGEVTISQSGGDVRFAAPDNSFLYQHRPTSCRWEEKGVLEMAGELVGPGMQWFNPWPGGGCYSVTAKYRSSGTLLGRPVQGFVGHEIHYFPPGLSWLASPFGKGREICWQQIANEYEDGAIEQATFAYGADGWGFAMIHDQHGAFHATTDVKVRAKVRPNGYPERITYQTAVGTWVWRIDPQGERARTFPGAPLGADGTCTREGERRRVVLSMGNSDWWEDGRADHLLDR